jgi:hypothetical protein
MVFTHGKADDKEGCHAEADGSEGYEQKFDVKGHQAGEAIPRALVELAMKPVHV